VAASVVDAAKTAAKPEATEGAFNPSHLPTLASTHFCTPPVAHPPRLDCRRCGGGG
jgi:hypothetical protein